MLVLPKFLKVNLLNGDEVPIAPPGIATDDAFLQNFVWGPSGTSLAFVYRNNIYYQASLKDAPRQITTTGELYVLYHGIPDWVYEEEVFGSSNAIWFSNDGVKMAYVTFDDSDVDVMRVPHYGIPGDVRFQYTRHHDIRYPKAGTNNPTVRVTLMDLNTNNVNIYEAPATDMDQPILKTVKFISNTAIALVWTNRVQTALRVQRCTAGVTACTTLFNYAETNGWIDNIPFFFNDAGNAFITILPHDVNGVLFKQIVQVTEGAATTRNRVNNPHTVLEILAWGSDDVMYGGPDTALVTRQWSLDWGSSLVSRWGIAVAHIDGRGSGLRGVANMFALNRKLGTVEVEDQIAGAKFIQDNFPWIDANRTCIWGWSYGGYAASKALAEGGDVFRCAAAVAPVVDWRFYDTIYTERYMGLPRAEDNAEGYAVSSLLTDQVAESLRDKSYFLIHGTADDNVHYQHAMLLSRLLQRRDVYFTQMSYTDEDHGLVGVRPHLYHALEKFLQEYML
ncbi:hypothetical protein HF086_012717 [Spodoptera exigua]|uniref:Venom dipeptidyl peptidase 4 n=1 Tax=Spodoptera exigua TaxID=7107 RepID=A0A922M867_SPOEX|nr:hypothetical protein HF086_012717 [Spodoptera exigua]